MKIDTHTFTIRIDESGKPFTTVYISTVEKDKEGLSGIILRNRPEGNTLIVCKFQPPQSVRYQYETFFILKEEIDLFREYCENHSLEILHIYE